MGVVKETRTCKLCRKEMPKANFYSPSDDVCKTCNPDWNFVKKARRLAREQGVGALHEKLKDYSRRSRLTREVLRSFTSKAK